MDAAWKEQLERAERIYNERPDGAAWLTQWIERQLERLPRNCPDKLPRFQNFLSLLWWKIRGLTDIIIAAINRAAHALQIYLENLKLEQTRRKWNAH